MKLIMNAVVLLLIQSRGSHGFTRHVLKPVVIDQSSRELVTISNLEKYEAPTTGYCVDMNSQRYNTWTINGGDLSPNTPELCATWCQQSLPILSDHLGFTYYRPEHCFCMYDNVNGKPAGDPPSPGYYRRFGEGTGPVNAIDGPDCCYGCYRHKFYSGYIPVSIQTNLDYILVRFVSLTLCFSFIIRQQQTIQPPLRPTLQRFLQLRPLGAFISLI